MKSIRGIFAALTTCAALAACGGGGDDTPAPAQPAVQQVVKKVGHLTVTPFSCARAGEAFVLGEGDREVACLTLATDVDVQIDGVPVEMTGSVDDSRLSSVRLVAGGETLSQLTDFYQGKLTLKTDFKLSAGSKMSLRVVGDVPYTFDPIQGVQVGFVVRPLEVTNLSPKEVEKVEGSQAVSTAMSGFRYVEPVAMFQQYGDHEYAPGAGTLIVSGKVVNPSNVTASIQRISVNFSGNYSGWEPFVLGCFSNLRIVQYDASGRRAPDIYLPSGQTYNTIEVATSIPAGGSSSIQVYADTNWCSAPVSGARLDASLQVDATYKGMKIPQPFGAWMSTTIFLPYSDGKG